MLNYEGMRLTNKKLIESLLAWRNDHGLYGSLPNGSNTSFTCTGYALSALVDSNSTYYSHDLGYRLKEAISSSSTGLLQNETETGVHIECNARPITALIQCFPHLVNDPAIQNILEWILNSRNSDGGWDLYPNSSESVGRALWTTSGVNALLEYRKAQYIMGSSTTDVLPGIVSGVNFLLSSRVDNIEIDTHKPWLWSYDGSTDSDYFDFNTSLNCIDCIIQSSRLLCNTRQEEAAISALCHLISIFDGVEYSPIRPNSVGVWTTIQEHQPKSYSRTYFTPSSVSMLLQYLDIAPPEYKHILLKYIEKQINWILENTVQDPRDRNNLAIRSSSVNPTVTVWATSQAISALSLAIGKASVLNQFYIFDKEKIESDAVEYTMKKIKDGSEVYSKIVAEHIIAFGKVVLGAIVVALIMYIGMYFLAPQWDAAEPFTYILGLIAIVVSWIIPGNKVPFLSRLSSSLSRVLHSKIMVRFHWFYNINFEPEPNKANSADAKSSAAD